MHASVSEVLWLVRQVIKPTWDVTSNGNKSITRAGVMLLEFAASAGQSQTSFGNRSYDWSKKQVLTVPRIVVFILGVGEGLDWFQAVASGGQLAFFGT